MPQAERKKTKRPPADIDFGMLSDLIGFNLRMAQNTMYRHYTSSVAKLRLGQREFAVLELIDRNPGVSQVDLAAVLGVDRPGMMTVIDRLQNRGLVIRKRSESDRRRQELHLTPKGRKLLVRVRVVVRGHEKVYASLFNKREEALLTAFLQRIAEAGQNPQPKRSAVNGRAASRRRDGLAARAVS